MTLLYGHDEAFDRMKRETMTPCNEVSITHDFYSENPERHPKPAPTKQAGQDVPRQKKAIGGAAKVRRNYPFTKKHL